jgi:hypothetical protein
MVKRGTAKARKVTARRGGAAKKVESAPKPPDPVVTGGERDLKEEHDVKARRQAAVKRLRVDGYAKHQIAQTILLMHISGGTSYLTFRPKADGTALSAEEMKTRAYDVIRQDFVDIRAEIAGETDALAIIDNRHILEERLREAYREAWDAAKKETDGARKSMLIGKAIEAAIKLARIQGIDTERPTVIKLPENWLVTVDDDGIIHRQQVDDETFAKTKAEQNARDIEN